MKGKKTGIIAAIVAAALVVIGAVVAFVVSRTNMIKVTDLSTSNTSIEMGAAEGNGNLGETESVSDVASKGDSDKASESDASGIDESLTPLMSALKNVTDEKGAASFGIFEGHTVNATSYWEEVDFGYTTTGVLEAETLEADPGLMLVYYLDADSYLNVALYKDNGEAAECLTDMPLSYKNIYDQDVKYIISNETAKAFGTEGIMGAKTFLKDGVTYLVTENNDWFVSEDTYYSGFQKGITPESNNHGEMAIYRVTADGIEGLYKVKFYAYGMDGGGHISVADFSNQILEEYNYSDLGEDSHSLDFFMDEYNLAMSNIGFSELTNTDNYALTQQGVLGDNVSWFMHWDCNTHLAEGDDVVTLEVTENSNVEENWRAWAPEVASAGEAESTEESVEDVEASPAAGENAYGLAAACSEEEDNNRYREFFNGGQYQGFAEGMYLITNGIEVKYAYVDLDGNGTDELLIGDSEGVYGVVTEADTFYNTVEVCGWRVQYGATPGEYIGNGCFVSSQSNGNNYGGEFMVDCIWKYSDNLKGCGMLARLSSSWDPNNVSENLNCWDYYEANDEGRMAQDEVTLKEGILDYTHEYIDYGDNYNFTEDGELETNELMDAYNSVLESHKVEGAFESLDWKNVADFN